MSAQSIFRFAPSPNGHLHLGHALSALLNQAMAETSGGRLLLRIEDIDMARCTPQFEQAIYEDLHWLELSWEEPVRRQSQHFEEYQKALTRLTEMGLVYPAFMSRGDIRHRIGLAEATGLIWPSDPDGVPHYPTNERNMSADEQMQRIESGAPYAWRLNMSKAIQACKAPLTWYESGRGPDGETGMMVADPARWGDVILARKDTPTSYHLSVVIDDAVQGVSHVVRGQDLFHATSVHRMLQILLDLPAPSYHHHVLVLGEDGHKLSKSRDDTALSSLRAQGLTPTDVRTLLGPYLDKDRHHNN